MVLENDAPFVKQNLGDALDTFTVRLNADERRRFDEDKKILEQKKDSTAIKQLALIGSIVLHDDLMRQVLGVVFENKRKNSRIGIVDFE